MIKLEEPVIRPPSEADSLLLQVTIGCSHNRCTFCGTYMMKKFRIRPVKDVLGEIDWAAEHFRDVRRVFLCDGNALCVESAHLGKILDRINRRFPALQRIGIYANAGDLLGKSVEELRSFREKKLAIAYLGLESGSDEVLLRAKKGNTAAEAVEAVQRAHEAGIKISAMTLLGLGGKELTEAHALDSAKVLNAMNPRFISFLTVVVLPNTALERAQREGRFTPPEPLEVVKELRTIVSNLEVTNSILRSNHVSNLVTLAGNLPRDKEHLLAQIDECLADPKLLRDRPFPYLL